MNLLFNVPTRFTVLQLYASIGSTDASHIYCSGLSLKLLVHVLCSNFSALLLIPLILYYLLTHILQSNPITSYPRCAWCLIFIECFLFPVYYLLLFYIIYMSWALRACSYLFICSLDACFKIMLSYCVYLFEVTIGVVYMIDLVLQCSYAIHNDCHATQNVISCF